MTREERAIMYFKDMRKRFCDDYLLCVPKDSVAYKATMAEKEFYDTAIEALKQESVLDKIRTEIEHITIAEGGDDYVRKIAELFSFKVKVLQIIDKYKEESEE